ncbi:MAG: bacteriocin family protein [Synergistaceae bacterium]|jgi:uncharacterized linocin/CFP29 family protein|nr:bacteriocin family protein [Synergistaceae bacterium]
MSILRRSTSEVSAEAWEELDRQAKLVFQTTLSARKVVDFVGPRGWAYAAHPLGRLQANTDTLRPDGVKYGIHSVLPLVELRRSFVLDMWELDNIERGCRNPDLRPLEEAARSVAAFEENAIYNGFEPAGIVGLSGAGATSAVDLRHDAEAGFLKSLTTALTRLRDASVQGPYALVACPSLWDKIYTGGECCPLSQKVKNITGGDIVRSTIEGKSFLLSRRGGDFELVAGQDLSLGYEERHGTAVTFFFAESFTFNVVNPEAVVPLIGGA